MDAAVPSHASISSTTDFTMPQMRPSGIFFFLKKKWWVGGGGAQGERRGRERLNVINSWKFDPSKIIGLFVHFPNFFLSLALPVCLQILSLSLSHTHTHNLYFSFSPFLLSLSLSLSPSLFLSLAHQPFIHPYLIGLLLHLAPWVSILVYL